MLGLNRIIGRFRYLPKTAVAVLVPVTALLQVPLANQNYFKVLCQLLTPAVSELKMGITSLTVPRQKVERVALPPVLGSSVSDTFSIISMKPTLEITHLPTTADFWLLR